LELTAKTISVRLVGGYGGLMEENQSKQLWRKMFRPSCFGSTSELFICVKTYFVGSPHFRMKPFKYCSYYNDCLQEHLRKRIAY
jgi:hypothetical protein